MIESPTYEIFKEDAMKSAKEEVRDEIREVRKKGLQEAIQMGLEIKFGDKGLALIPRIKAIDSLEKLEEIKSVVRTAETLHQVESVL